MRKGALLMLILLLLTSCQSDNKAPDNLPTESTSVTTEPTEATAEINRTQNTRKFHVTINVESAYEQVVVDSMAIKISGNYEQLNGLFYEKFSEGVLSNAIKSYEAGYGAKEISIDYIKTYDTYEALKEDETYIPEDLETAFTAYDESKIIFIAFNSANTYQTFIEKVSYANYGGNGQYYVVSKIDDAYLITYRQFLGN